MAANIGVSIGIDGEKEFRTNLRQLKNETKTFESELKELESSFNSETSAMEKNRKKREMLTRGVKDQEKRVEELEKSLEASKKKYGENAEQTQKWKKEVADAKTKLNKFKSELDKIPTSLSQVGKQMQKVGKSMQTVGESMTKYVTAPIVGVGAASIAAFQEVDDGLDSIAKKTGATGETLEGLEGAAKNIATTIPTTFEEAGQAVGSVNTKFGLTGKACEDLSSKFVKFAQINDQDVSTAVEGTQKVMAAFGLETEDAGDLLDAMNKTGQKTGISMEDLQSSMVKNAASLKAMGLHLTAGRTARFNPCLRHGRCLHDTLRFHCSIRSQDDPESRLRGQQEPLHGIRNPDCRNRRTRTQLRIGYNHRSRMRSDSRNHRKRTPEEERLTADNLPIPKAIDYYGGLRFFI